MTRRILRRGALARFWPFFVSSIGYIGSTFTLAFLWFDRKGSFKFHGSSSTDWCVLVALALFTLVGVITLGRRAFTQQEFTINRKDLVFLVGSIRSSAEVSIRIVAGDLSWLSDDLETLSEIRMANPSVEIYLYYQWDRVSADHKDDIERLIADGVKMQPYASHRNLNARFTLIDVENRNTARALTYQKLPPRQIHEPREKNQFSCIDYNAGKMAPVIEAFAAICQLLDQSRPAPIRVSVSGINNVGKTQLATVLRGLLMSRGLSVRFVPDQFRLHGGGAARDVNFVILMRSFLELQRAGPEQVVVFDRSILDDYIFMRLRSPIPLARDPLARTIADAAKGFSLILRVNHQNARRLAATTRVTSEDRVKANEMFGDFFNAFDIPVREIATVGDHDPNETDPVIEQIADQIQSLVHYAMSENRLR